MGIAISQCQNHNCQDIRGECRCVTVNVIKPVAVTAVSSCRINFLIIKYIVEKRVLEG